MAKHTRDSILLDDEPNSVQSDIRVEVSLDALAEAEELAKLMSIKFGTDLSCRNAIEMLINQELDALTHQFSKSCRYR